MFVSGLLALVLPAYAVEWPDVTEGLARTNLGSGDVAVIVGVEAYDHLPARAGAVASAQDWRAVLQARGVSRGNMRLLTDDDVTAEDVLREIAWAEDRVHAGATFWFVYVGHGAPASDGQDGLLVGPTAEPGALDAGSLRRGAVLQALHTGIQATSMLVLDTSFSGRTGPGEQDVLAPGLTPLDPAVLAVDGRLTLCTAGGLDQAVGVMPGTDRSAFSYLAQGALRGWADADGDGRVTATELITYTGRALAAVAPARHQVPELQARDPNVVLAMGSERGPELPAQVVSDSE